MSMQDSHQKLVLDQIQKFAKTPHIFNDNTECLLITLSYAISRPIVIAKKSFLFTSYPSKIAEV